MQMREYCQDVLTWITDMTHSTVVNSDQRMDLILTDFFLQVCIQKKSKSY